MPFPLFPVGGKFPNQGQHPFGTYSENLGGSDALTLKKKRLSFCAEAWPQYKLEEEAWPPDGNTNYDAVLRLDLICKCEGEGGEVPLFSVLGVLRED